MGDDEFGPQLQGTFDFTLRFELILFSIVPSIFLFIALPFYFYSLLKNNPRTNAGFLLWVKLVFALALLAVQAAALARFHQPYAQHGMKMALPTAAASMSFLSAILITAFVYVGHVYHCSSPAFLGLFLTITVLLDCAEARSLSLRTGFVPIAGLKIAVSILKFFMIVLEEISKRSILRDKDLRSSLGREATAGFWSRSFFFWMNGFLITGFRREITKDDIGNIGFETEELYDNFAHCWKEADKQSKFALLVSCVKAVPELFIFVIFPRLMSIGFNFSQPFLLQKIVNTVAEEDQDPRVTSALIGATALIYTGKSMCTAWYSSYRVKIRISVRGVVIAALYNKSLRLTADELSKAAVLTLMSTDVNGIQGLISLSYESWARVIEIGLGLGILAAFVGPACIFTLIPAVISSILSTFATRKMTVTRKRWNERIEVRVAETSMMLSQIKDLKMTGLAPVIAQKLQEQMKSEIKVSMGDRHARCLTWAICALVETATPALVIGATLFWTRASEGLSVADFYTTLALTTMVTVPFANILLGLPYWATAWASVQRVQEYLCKDERLEYRQFEIEDTPSENKSLFADGLELDQTPMHQSTSSTGPAIKFNNVSVYSLKNASFEVPKGSKVMLRGSVGSGKSTILKALLGEVKLQSGDISLFSKSVACCEQEPWIMNTTIEQNIIGDSPRDTARLQRVTYVCALNDDLDRLPNGIMTLAGSEGCNLSGGQKQRISLARGLYLGAEILLLDDVFSALDIPTASLIRKRMFGQGGYLEENPTTLMMATNIEQHLQDADCVFEVSADGQVQQIPARPLEHDPSTPNTTKLEQCEDGTSADDMSEKEASVVRVSPADAEPKQKRYGDWSLYGYFFGAAGLRNIGMWLSAVILAAVVERFPTIYVRIWQDKHAGNNIYYIGYAILSFANPLSNLLCSLAYFYLVNSAAAKSLHRTLADTTSHATLDFLTKEDTSVLLNRFSQDISVATQELPLYIMPTSWLFFTIFIDIAIIASGANYASPILPLFLVLVYGVQYFYLRTSRQLRFLELDASKALYKHFKESSKGIFHIRAFQWQDGFTKQLYIAVDETQRPVYSLACIQQWLSTVLSSATAVAAICVVTLALKFTSQTSQPAIGLALLSLITFSELLSEWIAMWTGTETSIGAVSRTRQFSQSTPVEEDPKDDGTAADIPASWPQSGSLELISLSASYQAKSSAPRTAFEDVSVSISSGKKVGIVGRTGSGKTSVLLSILHLLDHSGSVRIDGIDIRRVPRNVLRSRITTITQSGIELPGSVRFNINPFPVSMHPGQLEVTDEMIVDVLRRIGSGLWESIESRGGLDANMSELQLSQGQKQLIQLARAVIHKQCFGSKIVLVDEGSASLDQATENRVQDIVDEEFRDCTVITVSHRPGALQHIDFFVRMNDGRAEVLHSAGVSSETSATQ